MYTPVTLDKARNISLGFEGLQLFKKMTGKSLAKLDYKNEDMEDYIPVVFHCGLIHEDAELTLEQTTKLIDKYLGVSGALRLLPDIMEETFGEDANEGKNAQGAALKKATLKRNA